MEIGQDSNLQLVDLKPTVLTITPRLIPFVKSYFGKNEPLTNWTLLSPIFFQISTDLENNGRQVFNWSEVHFHRSNFLQNPYFSHLLDSKKLYLLDPKILLAKFPNVWTAWVRCSSFKPLIPRVVSVSGDDKTDVSINRVF